MQTLAMHMANELLSPAVAAVTLVAAGIVVAFASARSIRGGAADKAPLMGVMGAFVFAAQMINFTLPGMPGTSGHFVGGVLLAILLGPWAAIAAMAGILIVQCLLFQDGGLLALGCNIINMGVVPCLLGWGLYRALLGSAAASKAWRQYLAAWAACTVGVVAGAALVPVEAAISGVLRVPLVDFLQVMIGVHVLIGLVEGAITFAVVAYLRRVRPETVGLAAPAAATHKAGASVVLASLAASALLLAGVISWFASTHPDGLEWTYQQRLTDQGHRTAVDNPAPVVAAVDQWQAKYSPMSDYTRRTAPLGQEPAEEGQAEGEAAKAHAAWPNVSGWGSAAGVIGTLVTLILLYIPARLLRKRQAAPPGAAWTSPPRPM